MDIYPRCNVQETAMECYPLHVERKMLRHVYVIAFCGNRIKRILQLQLVDVDRYAGIPEVFQPAGVIEVQVAHDDQFDVFDVVPRAGDLGGQGHVLCVSDASEDIIDVGPDDFGVVVSGAGFEED